MSGDNLTVTVAMGASGADGKKSAGLNHLTPAFAGTASFR